MGNLKFGNVSTKDLELVIQAPPLYEFPEPDVSVVHIPGKSGDVVIDNDSFKNVARTYSIASVFKPGTDFVGNSERLIAWLTANPGYHRLEDSYDPNVYRLAMFRSKGSLQNYYDKATILTVTFDCKPQRYLKIGENPKEFKFYEINQTSGEVTDLSPKIENPTLMKSLPLITLDNIRSASGSIESTDTDKDVLMFNIKNYKEDVTASITLTNLDEDSITIDSEKQLVYTENNQNQVINLNKYVNLNGKTFPKLERGFNYFIVKKYKEINTDIGKYSDLIAEEMDTLFAKYMPFDTLLESKSSKAEIMSFNSLKEKYLEEYDQEAYGNLALEKAEHTELKDFNRMLDENCFIDSFNTDINNGPDKDYINTIEYVNGIIFVNGRIHYVSPGHSIDVNILRKTKNGLLAVFYTINSGKFHIFPLIAQSKNQNNQTTNNGCFIKLANSDDGSYDSNRIFYSFTVSLDDLTSYATLKDIYSDVVNTDMNTKELTRIMRNNSLSTKSLYNLFEKNDQGRYEAISNNITLKIYPVNSQRYLDLKVDQSDCIEIEIIYSQSSNPQPGDTIDKILYMPKKAGYFYKPKTDNGLFSSLISNIPGVSTIINIFNKPGWNKVESTDMNKDAFEVVEWDNNTKLFATSDTSKTSDYVVERYYLDPANLPQYEDVVLEGTYVLDENGQEITDAAGNKINKVIKNRIEIISLDDKVENITGIKILYSGYYKFNSGTAWNYYTQGTTFTGDNIPSDFKKETKSANNIYFLESVPDYRNISNFPEWLDPIPVLMDSNGNIYGDNVQTRINASYYDFKVKSKGWYYYNYIENDISKRTIFDKRVEDQRIGIINYDPAQYGRKSDEDFTIYQVPYIDESADFESASFPLNEYEYVDSEDGSYILNRNDILEWQSDEQYHKGDIVCSERSVGQQYYYVYIAIVEEPQINVRPSNNPDQWKELGNLIEAKEFSKENTYHYTDFCIYNRYLWMANENVQPGNWDETKWINKGNYIKNIGFYYLSDSTKEKELEYPCNVLPDWIEVNIKRGEANDYSDTILEFFAKDDILCKYDDNTDWADISIGDSITESSYKVDTYIYKLPQDPSSQPQYPSSDYYEFTISRSSTGNPDKVYISAKIDGYFKIGNSSNYEYHKQGDILKELNVNQDASIIYLNPQDPDSYLANIRITVIPRWWSL